MKKNDMLNESTIRRFMKLATIDGLTDKFVAENLKETTDEVDEGRMRAKRDDDEMREGEHDDEVDEGRMRAKRDDDEMREGEHDDEVDEGRMRAKRDEDDMDEMRDKRDDEVDEGRMRGDDEEMDEVAIEEEDAFEEKMDMDEPAAGGMVSVDQLMSALEKALEDVLGQEVEVSQDDDEMEMDMDMDMDTPDAGDELDLDADAKEDEEEDLEETAIQPDVVEEVFARVIQRLTQETKSNKE